MSKGARAAIDSAYRALFSAKRDAQESWQIISTWHVAQGDERSQTIVAGALLEQALEHALSSHFNIPVDQIPHFFADPETPLNLHAKIKLAEALGIIERDIIGRELVRIKNIRNVFAHARQHLDYDDDAIRAYCDTLTIPALDVWGGIGGGKPITAKEKYAASVRITYGYLASAIVNRLVREPLRFETNDFYCLVFLGRPTKIALAQAILARRSQRKSPRKDTPDQ